VTVPVVVGTGLVALDVVFRGSSKRPLRRCAGGTCGNVLIALRYLGWKAVPVARLAADRARVALEADLARWGLDLRFLDLPPHGPTPIIVERVISNDRGEPTHRFSWMCPCCGALLPRYKPVRASDVDQVAEEIRRPAVFFFVLATTYASVGTLIVFEPSASSEPALFNEAIEAADIVKYSDQRLAAIPDSTSRRRRLEIQTLGAAGLRYRITSGRKRTWRQVQAIPAGHVVDTAGAGDWCTAGLLERLANGGRQGFENASDRDVHEAIRYGQALSAWNCRFEGARGGMYERTREQFMDDVDSILAGAKVTPGVDATELEIELDEICPLCPGPRREATVASAPFRVSGAPRLC